MKYPIHSFINVTGSDVWMTELTGDYEIIGHTTINELDNIAVSLYDIWFKDKNKDDVYEVYKENNIGVYIAKVIKRDPYDIDIIPDGGEEVGKLIYFCDEILNHNATIFLVKRINLGLNISVGNFFDTTLTDEFKTLMEDNFGLTAGEYSDAHFITNRNIKVFLQDRIEADAEDKVFKDKQDKIEADKAAAEEAERLKEEALRNREKEVIRKEAFLAQKEQELRNAQIIIEKELAELEKKKEALLIQEQELERLRLMLADRQFKIEIKEADLAAREEAIIKREEELGIRPSKAFLESLKQD